MRHAVLAAWCVVVASLAGTVSGGAQVMWYGVAAGDLVPYGDLHDGPTGVGYNAGWDAAALLNFYVSGTPSFGLRLEGSYGQNTANSTLQSGLRGIGADNSTTTLAGVSVDFTYTFPSSSLTKGYVLAGFGVYNFKLSVSANGVTADTSADEVAWNVGAGVAFHLSGGSALFVEARYFALSPAFTGLNIRYLPVIVAGIRSRGP